MNFRPIAGIDVGKFFSEMAILSPSNEVIARMKIRHDSSTDVEFATDANIPNQLDLAAQYILQKLSWKSDKRHGGRDRR